MLYVNSVNINRLVGKALPDVTKVIWWEAEIDQIHLIDLPDLKELIIKNVDLVMMSVLNHLPLKRLTVIDSRVGLNIPSDQPSSSLTSLNLEAANIIGPGSLSSDLCRYPKLKQLFLSCNINYPFWRSGYENMPETFLPELEILHCPGVVVNGISPLSLLHLRSLQTFLTGVGSQAIPSMFHYRPFQSFIRRLPANNVPFTKYCIGRVERNRRSYDTRIMNTIRDTPLEGDQENFIDAPSDHTSDESPYIVSTTVEGGEPVDIIQQVTNGWHRSRNCKTVMIKSDKITPIQVELTVTEEEWRRARVTQEEIQTFANALNPKWLLEGIRFQDPTYPSLGIIDPGLARILAIEKIHHYFLMTPYEIYSYFSTQVEYISRLCARKNLYFFCHTNDLDQYSSMENIYFFFASCSMRSSENLENPVLRQLRLLMTILLQPELNNLPQVPPEIFQYIGRFLV